MATLLGLVGESGTGKSTSIENLNPETTFIINVASKPLPFRGWRKKYSLFNKDNPRGNYYASHKVEDIGTIMNIVDKKRTDIEVLIIEDSSYLMSFEIFDRAKENSFTKQVEIADHYSRVLRNVQTMRDDLIVVVITHPDEERDTMGEVIKRKIKTYGKMTDKYMSLDGLFTYVLFSGVLTSDESGVPPRYVFDTNDPSKVSTAKSPRGVFEERYIDNDLKYVIERINAYNDGE